MYKSRESIDEQQSAMGYNRISYCITVCQERKEVAILLNQLFKYIRPVDEIIVLFDEKNGSDEVREYLETIENITLIRANFDNDFATFKKQDVFIF